MSEKIDADVWPCPECDAPILPEERESIAKMLAKGHSQVEFRCDECGEGLTADTTDCPEGEVSLNADWVYG